jgi:hypothetical protein
LSSKGTVLWRSCHKKSDHRTSSLPHDRNSLATSKKSQRGEAITLCKDALASGPFNTRQLAMWVMAAKGLDTGATAGKISRRCRRDFDRFRSRYSRQLLGHES